MNFILKRGTRGGGDVQESHERRRLQLTFRNYRTRMQFSTGRLFKRKIETLQVIKKVTEYNYITLRHIRQVSLQ
jgi:hypothetical protein